MIFIPLFLRGCDRPIIPFQVGFPSTFYSTTDYYNLTETLVSILCDAIFVFLLYYLFSLLATSSYYTKNRSLFKLGEILVVVYVISSFGTYFFLLGNSEISDNTPFLLATYFIGSYSTFVPFLLVTHSSFLEFSPFDPIPIKIAIFATMVILFILSYLISLIISLVYKKTNVK